MAHYVQFTSTYDQSVFVNPDLVTYVSALWRKQLLHPLRPRALRVGQGGRQRNHAHARRKV